jgi:hypothetical protein
MVALQFLLLHEILCQKHRFGNYYTCPPFALVGSVRLIKAGDDKTGETEKHYAT